MSSEVLIYVQNFRHHYDTHKDVQEYFNASGKEDSFFGYITEIAQRNFDFNGEPHLTIEQFEDIRKIMIGTDNYHNVTVGIFISMGDYGLVSLN